MIDIIIVKYGLPEYEKECIAQVKKVTETPHTITAYDNFDKDEHLSVVWNRLIRNSSADYICLLNNDTIVNRTWLEKMLEVFDEKENVGIVGPISNTAGSIQGGFLKPYPEKKIQRTNMLSGFCMLFKKSLWEEVGGFDEDFALYGEDNDFCMRVMKAGYQLFVRYDAYVFHYGRRSTPNAVKKGKDINNIRKESHERYCQKWN